MFRRFSFWVGIAGGYTLTIRTNSDIGFMLLVDILGRKQALLSNGASQKIGGWWLAMKKVTNPPILCRAPQNRLKSLRAGCYVYRPCRISLVTLRSHKVMGNFAKSHRIYVKLSHINFHLKFFGIKQCWEPGSIILQGQWLKKEKRKISELLHACWMTCSWLYWLIKFFRQTASSTKCMTL